MTKKEKIKPEPLAGIFLGGAPLSPIINRRIPLDRIEHDEFKQSVWDELGARLPLYKPVRPRFPEGRCRKGPIKFFSEGEIMQAQAKKMMQEDDTLMMKDLVVLSLIVGSQTAESASRVIKQVSGRDVSVRTCGGFFSILYTKSKLGAYLTKSKVFVAQPGGAGGKQQTEYSLAFGHFGQEAVMPTIQDVLLLATTKPAGEKSSRVCGKKPQKAADEAPRYAREGVQGSPELTVMELIKRCLDTGRSISIQIGERREQV